MSRRLEVQKRDKGSRNHGNSMGSDSASQQLGISDDSELKKSKRRRIIGSDRVQCSTLNSKDKTPLTGVVTSRLFPSLYSSGMRCCTTCSDNRGKSRRTLTGVNYKLSAGNS